jgi:hypothetical protein
LSRREKMSNSKWWEDREDKTIVGRHIISISRDLLSSLSSLSSHDITLPYARGISSFEERNKFFFLTLDPVVFREDREDREDKRPVDSGFQVKRWEDRFKSFSYKIRPLIAFQFVFPPKTLKHILAATTNGAKVLTHTLKPFSIDFTDIQPRSLNLSSHLRRG